MAGKKAKAPKQVETLVHADEKRRNIPTAEYQAMVEKEQADPLRVAYERRNRDLDPQLVWRGKDMQDWSDLVVHAPPLYIQEKVHPKVLIDDLKKLTASTETADSQLDMFADFNGIPEGAEKTEFYQHDQNWSNRMILGDSLAVMASLAEREALRGKVQCIYFDPPYGIKFNSNFQWSTTSRDVKDGKADHITREPEQVKAFRDTWRDGIHSYLTYLRDRLTVARDLLTDSGSIFVQIGDENVHRVRALMDEVFGEDNFVSQVVFEKTSSTSTEEMASISDHIVWFAKSKPSFKFRTSYRAKVLGEAGTTQYVWFDEGGAFDRRLKSEEFGNCLASLDISRVFACDNLTSQRPAQGADITAFNYNGATFAPGKGTFKTDGTGLSHLAKAGRLRPIGRSLMYRRFVADFPVVPIANYWNDVKMTGFSEDKTYIVQTGQKVIQRCILMTTDPGDLVLDPTCGSGTTAYVAEQWGRRWITIDTSRVALALARARIMGARYPFYLLADSPEGQKKEGEVTRTVPSSQPTYGNIRHGFVYERVPHITLKSIANNTEIDVIWEEYQQKLEPLREQLNKALGTSWEEWEIPRELPRINTNKHESKSKAEEALAIRVNSCSFVVDLHSQWWKLRIARQREIDASITAKAEHEFLYDKPYEDNKKVRVAGPFTVESLSPHRMLGVDEDDELLDTVAEAAGTYGRDFATMILDNLRTAGVQQAHKEDKINFISLEGWPGPYICGVGTYTEGNKENGKSKRAGIFIGPEFGTVSRPDLVAAAREAAECGFDVLIACAFNFEARTTEFDKLGQIPVLKARMNADLHMADDLKNTGKGNLFVIFGEPDIEVVREEWIVDSNKERIAPYEIFKLISGTNSLAEINRLERDDLRSYAELSCRGEIWDYLADAASRHIDTGKHSRGASTPGNGGVSTVAWHCAGIAGGIGNVCDTLRKAGVLDAIEWRNLVKRLRGNQQNAARLDAVARSSQITTNHYPLSTRHYLQVEVKGVDVFHPSTGEVRSDGPDGIACWFIDTDYNEESFFVRHAYFLGQNDPYKSLKTTLKAEINAEAWESLHSAVSRPFDKPASGRIAVKVINHLGDEVMKVFRVELDK